MSAVAPLPERELRVRESDLRRSPLQRRAMPRSAVNSAHVGARSVGPKTTTAPQLEVVPQRRRTMSIVVVCGLLLFSMLIGAVAFQTQIARNQLALDKTNRSVTTARGRYDVLRRQRAELRSPNRLAVEAARLGMAPAQNGEFMTISADVVAAVAAAASGLPAEVSDPGVTSLDQFGQVKSVTGDVP
jgi:hypothetical protein